MYFAEAWSVEDYEKAYQKLPADGAVTDKQSLDTIILNILNYADDHMEIFKKSKNKPLSELSVEHRTMVMKVRQVEDLITCLLYTSPSPRDKRQSRMPSSA